MRKLTQEEASKIKRKANNRGSIARGILISMNVGEMVLLEPKDWNQKTQTPSTYCLQLSRQTGMKWKCEVALDGSGWVIERVK